MHCFLLDEETNGNGANTPESLKGFLDNYDEDQLKKDQKEKESKPETLDVPASKKQDPDASNNMDWIYPWLTKTNE